MLTRLRAQNDGRRGRRGARALRGDRRSWMERTCRARALWRCRHGYARHGGAAGRDGLRGNARSVPVFLSAGGQRAAAWRVRRNQGAMASRARGRHGCRDRRRHRTQRRARSGRDGDERAPRGLGMAAQRHQDVRAVRARGRLCPGGGAFRTVARRRRSVRGGDGRARCARSDASGARSHAPGVRARSRRGDRQA
jgi:hypothetical protein